MDNKENTDGQPAFITSIQTLASIYNYVNIARSNLDAGVFLVSKSLSNPLIQNCMDTQNMMEMAKTLNIAIGELSYINCAIIDGLNKIKNGNDEDDESISQQQTSENEISDNVNMKSIQNAFKFAENIITDNLQ